MTDVHALYARDFNAVILFLPSIVAASIVLILGWIIAFVLDRLVAAGLRRIGFDGLAIRTGMIEDFARVGLRMEPARLIGGLIFWIVLTGAIVEAADILELAVVSRSLGTFVAFLPHIVIAVAIALGGIVIGDMVGRGTAGAMSRSGVLYHDLTGGFVRTAIIVIAIFIALEQLTVESAFFFEIFLVAFASIALAFAIALGWGARAFAADSLSGRFIEKHFSLGDRITFVHGSGTIERFDILCTIVRTEDGRRLTIPNSVLTSAVIETDDRTYDT